MEDILAKKNRHLFLEEKTNTNNSFIGNVNTLVDDLENIDTVASNIEDVNTVANNIDKVNTVADNIEDITTAADNLDVYQEFNENLNSGILEALLERLDQGGNQWILRLTELGESIMATTSAFNYAVVVTVDSAIAANSIISIPDYLKYRVGTHMLLVSWNGTVCYNDEQYQEVGDFYEWSTSIRIKQNLKAGDKLEFRTVALASYEQLSSLPVQVDGTSEIRTLSERFGDIVNVKDYGAKGDGTTNDTTAFQNAIATGKAVFVPEGSYVLTTDLTGDFCSIGNSIFIGGTINGSTILRGTAQRNSDIINVRDYGAKGDGETDDYQSIQNALNAGYTSGKAVWVPGGTYLIGNSRMLVLRNGQTLFGDHGQTTIIRTDNCAAQVLGYSPTLGIDDHLDDVTIKDIIFDGGYEDETVVSQLQSVVGFPGVKRLLIDGCTFQHGSGYGLAFQAYSGIGINQQSPQESIVINNCVFYHNGRNATSDPHCGLNIKKSNRCRISNCTAYENGDGGIHVRGESVIVENCISYNNGVAGFTITYGLESSISATYIGCSAYGNGNYGFRITEAENYLAHKAFMSLSGCIAYENGSSGFECLTDTTVHQPNWNGGNYAVAAYYTTSIMITNSTFKNNGANNLHIGSQSCEAIKIVNSCFYGGVHAINVPYAKIDISNCSISGPDEWGIRVSNSNINQCTIESCALALSGAGNKVSKTVFLNNTAVHNADLGLNTYFDCTFSGNSGAVPFAVTNERIANFGGGVLRNDSAISNASLYLMANGTGAVILRNGDQNTVACSSASLYPNPDPDGVIDLGNSARRWKAVYAAAGTIQTSDERLKRNIQVLSEPVLRAWGKVRLKVFQFTDAIELKGEKKARLHIGVIAQEIQDAFASEGLDASVYGLFCYDKWDDKFEDVRIVDKPPVYSDDGEIIEQPIVHTEKRCIQKAGDRYAVRYDEALALECAYQRWLGEQRDAKIEVLMQRISALENNQ